MSNLKRLKKLSFIVSNPQIITCRTQYLFILSHMRSRSSLLSHILGSNPSICGYSELHKHYFTRKDFLEMRIQLYKEFGWNIKNKYLLDKILHNFHGISPKIFKMAKPKVIFLLRDSKSTLESLIAMGYQHNKEKYKDANKALEYYRDRLSYLEKYAQQLEGDYYFIESDDLVENTDQVLANLSTWLNLEQPLVKNYSIFKKTSKVGHGDFSNNLKSGTILKATRTDKESEIPDEVLEKGKYYYNKCKQVLLKWHYQ